MDFLVWALRLPTNVEKAVRDLQNTLFRRHGLASALALPALVPLLCLRPPARLYARSPQPAARPPAPARLRAAALAESQGCLLVRLDPQESLEQLAKACRSLGPRGAALLRPAPLPCALGVFLCFLEGSGPPEVDPGEVRALSEASFPGLHLSLLRVTSLGAPDLPDPWWSALSWEELQRQPLRKGGASPPASA